MSVRSRLAMMGLMMAAIASNPQDCYTIPERKKTYKQFKLSNLSSTSLKCNRPLHEFTIKGHTIMAYSRKDAIKRLKFKKLI